MISLVVLAATGCAAAGTVEGPAEVRVVASAAHAAISPETKLAVLASDDATFRAEWSRLIGAAEIPAVDFATESVVFLLAGERNTGGYSIETRGATVEGDVLVVDAIVRGPAPRSIVTQVITSPCAVIAVKARGVTAVRWRE